MGYLLNILLAVLSLGLADVGAVNEREWPIAVAVACVVPVLLGRVVRAQVLLGRFRVAEVLARVLSFSPPALFALAIGELGWTHTVERWCGSSASFLDWPTPALFVVLLPYVVLQLVAIDARARSTWTPSAARRWRTFQARMFLSALAPIALYAAVSIVIGFFPELRTRIEEVALYNALFAATMLAMLGVTLPFLLRSMWDTEPVPAGEQRAVLELVSRHARFRARELLVWRTGQTMSNAAIVGLGPRTRVVLFSDLLLSQLDPRELAAVFAHEMGHAVRRHVLVFVALAVGFFLTMDWIATKALGDEVWIAGGFVIASLAVGYLGFGWLSRRFELEADLFSLELLGDPQALIGALEKVGGSFRDVASWRHFSTARRVDFLQRTTHDPHVARALRRVLSIAKWAAAALLVTGIALETWSAVSVANEQLVRAELKLGSYARARELAAKSKDLEHGLTLLVERTRDLGADAVTIEELEQRTRAALRAGDLSAAWSWAGLGAFRGSEELARVGDALQARVNDPTASLYEALGDELWPSWSDDLAGLR
jgi:Zn-dependent protease with chaperone function